MRRTLVYALGGLFSIVALSALVAQQPGAVPATAGTSVVVIDIAYVFKKHARFIARMEEIKRDIEQYDAYVREENRKFNALKEQLVTFKAGSPEYKQKEVELAQMQSKMQVDVGLKRKEFLEQEARVYYETYLEIEREVATFAQRYRINLVVRYNREEMKPDDRNSILQGVNRAVVFQQNLDITDFILEKLNVAAPVTQGPTSQGPPGIQTSPQRPIVPGRNAPPIQR